MALTEGSIAHPVNNGHCQSTATKAISTGEPVTANHTQSDCSIFSSRVPLLPHSIAIVSPSVPPYCGRAQLS
eukprot:scaffold306066_cov39-Attheya_sp.AAC.1